MRFVAVSYTHLDVYKRQVESLAPVQAMLKQLDNLASLCDEGVKLIMIGDANDVSPVSYTHLDVYKRQRQKHALILKQLAKT